VRIPDIINLTVRGQTVTYSAEDSIIEKGVSPIPSGGMVRGILMAEFDGGLERILRAPGTAFTLVCKDVSGKCLFGEFGADGRKQGIEIFARYTRQIRAPTRYLIFSMP